MAKPWYEQFAIGDGEYTTDEDAPSLYRSYSECGITMTQEKFDEIAKKYAIYVSTTGLKDIVYTPKTVIKQTTSDYYFTHLQVKFQRYK